MKKLSEAKNGETGVISAICGDTRFLSRVTSIGLTIGCPVTVLQNERKRPILIFSRDSMIALDRGECDNIQMRGDKTLVRYRPKRRSLPCWGSLTRANPLCSTA